MAFAASSAFPPGRRGDEVPLAAPAHAVLSGAPSAESLPPVEQLVWRYVEEVDLPEVEQLHAEWFPLAYSQNFFRSLVDGSSLALVAALPDRRRPTKGGAIVGLVSATLQGEESERLLTSSYCPARLRRPPGQRFYDRLAYVRTLGVVDAYRRRGLARALIERTLAYYARRGVPAVYLNVVPYNTAAKRLYESFSFRSVSYIRDYYLIDGKMFDGELYACYLDGGRPVAPGSDPSRRAEPEARLPRFPEAPRPDARGAARDAREAAGRPPAEPSRDAWRHPAARPEAPQPQGLARLAAYPDRDRGFSAYGRGGAQPAPRSTRPPPPARRGYDQPRYDLPPRSGYGRPDAWPSYGREPPSRY